MQIRQIYQNNIFVNPSLFIALGIIILLFVLAYFVPGFYFIAPIGLGVIGLIFLLDLAMLFQTQSGLLAQRECPEKFSNGDENAVFIYLANRYRFSVSLKVIDELPFQFQYRSFVMKTHLKSGQDKKLMYPLKPLSRGEYHFGALNVFVSGPIGFLQRRYQLGRNQMVPTFPSFIQMRQYQLMAISNRLTELGVKKIRRLGHTTEFEQIKEYVRGDDYRTINWKATARSGKLMVNQYIDERAQNVYCLIDKSRTMRMPFEGMALLDYAINASLVLSNIAIYKQDRGGLITFADQIHDTVPASSRVTQMNLIMEVLYNQETQFLEADYARLYTHVKRSISQRSLLILFTNFNSIAAMRRMLPYLKKLNHYHLLMVVFFVNTELDQILNSQPTSVEGIYIKTIGEHFAFEKQQIVRELEQHGIIAILSPPQSLTVNTLNKYLELKSKGMV